MLRNRYVKRNYEFSNGVIVSDDCRYQYDIKFVYFLLFCCITFPQFSVISPVAPGD